jgi:cell division protein FtsB
MERKNIWQKFIAVIEKILPMKIGAFFLFLLILYFVYIVGRSIWVNDQANKQIVVEQQKIDQLKFDIKSLENQINYLQTYSFVEEEARSKLGYKGVGEKMMAVPIDKKEETIDQALSDIQIKIPNYTLWWRYFFE